MSKIKRIKARPDDVERVYRDMRTGRIDPADSTKLAFVLANIGKQIEADLKNLASYPSGCPHSKSC